MGGWDFPEISEDYIFLKWPFDDPLVFNRGKGAFKNYVILLGGRGGHQKDHKISQGGRGGSSKDHSGSRSQNGVSV